MKVFMNKYGADVVGLIGHALIVAGVWGRCGWHDALIVAGLPFAAFWIWGEYRTSRGES